MSVSDFRSDTVTKPSPEMRAAILAAMDEDRLGDDVLDGDPTVGELERLGAEWLGKDAAVYVPSGTMANQVALGSWTRPGDEIIVQRWAHVTSFESGSAGFLHGLQSITLGGLEGRMDPDLVRDAIRPTSIHCPGTALVCVEQTHNMAGGKITPLADLEAIRGLTRECGIPVHMDGARLANAVVGSGVSAATYAAQADSVSLCLSKGLGAPVGSLIAGPAEFIERARFVRKRLGGWMRQAGVLAAAGIVALRDGVERLEEDHRLAKAIAEGLSGRPGLTSDPADVDTNIVMVKVDPAHATAAEVAAAWGEHGVLAIPMAEQLLRLVTHRDVGHADLERLLEVANR